MDLAEANGNSLKDIIGGKLTSQITCNQCDFTKVHSYAVL